MRCRDARRWLAAQHDGNLAQSDVSTLHTHLQHCPACRTYEQHHHSLTRWLGRGSPQAYASISTERIMLAVQQQKCIIEQLENLRSRQQSRVARISVVGAPLAAILFFTLASIPLLLLALTIIQPDVFVKTLSLLSDLVDLLLVLAQYLQTGLTLVTQDGRLLSGVAFVLVIMMGMWLRLMRHPQEA